MGGSRLRSISPKPAPVAAVLVCFLMSGALIGVPWLFIDPYETSDRHVITHESTDAFDDVSTNDPTPIHELSPSAQTVVERGITAYQKSSSERVSYSVKFCREELPVCDEVERPNDFTYTSTYPGEVYDVIEADDGVYILKTTDGTIGADPGPFSGLEAKHIVFIAIILPVSCVLLLLAFFGQFGYKSTGGGAPNQKVISGLSLYGTLIIVVGIVDPLLDMYYNLSLSQDFLMEGILLTWGIVLATILHPLFDG